MPHSYPRRATNRGIHAVVTREPDARKRACPVREGVAGHGTFSASPGGLPRGSKPHPGHSAGQGASSALGRVREAARRDKDARFTALLHHVTLGRLRAAYWAISPKAAPGVDGVTWSEYGQALEAN